MAARRTVTVIGSLNIDFVTRTSRLPFPGETLSAISFEQGFGGKGTNQAVACARLATADVNVQMIGSIGEDKFGRDYLDALQKEGINTKSIRRIGKTGMANIVVEEASGENRIMFVPNANYAFREEYDQGWDLFVNVEVGNVVVFQLEMPLQVLHNIATAKEQGKHVILNPAPAMALPKSAYRNVHTLILNESEASILTGTILTGTETLEQLTSLSKLFLSWGVRESAIITLGCKGLVFAMACGDSGHMAAHKVDVVDTTAAGDTFVGAYAVQRARSSSIATFDYKKALAFATRAASQTVQKSGAMVSIPRLGEL